MTADETNRQGRNLKQDLDVHGESAMMAAGALASGNAVWFLIGPFDSGETIRYLPIYSVPFAIGRRQDLALSLTCKTVSSLHAEITEAGESLVLRDLGSTNGTYVNGKRITGTGHARGRRPRAVCQHGVSRPAADRSSPHAHRSRKRLRRGAGTGPVRQTDVAARRDAVLPAHRIDRHQKTRRLRSAGAQPFVRTGDAQRHVPRGRAAQPGARAEHHAAVGGVQSSRALPESTHLFVNTHPRELAEPGLFASLQALREGFPNQPLTLEIHESAVADGARMAEIRTALTKLNIGLAYDDFGAGQARLNELVESPPDYLKFDMSLIRDIHAASPQRQQVLASLVQMVRKLGIVSLAEGIENEAEAETCLQMGFDLAQGFFYGKPAALRGGTQ